MDYIINEIIVAYNHLKSLVESKKIHNFKLNFDSESETLDVYFTPIKTIEKIDVSFMITQSGTSFQ